MNTQQEHSARRHINEENPEVNAFLVELCSVFEKHGRALAVDGQLYITPFQSDDDAEHLWDAIDTEHI